MDKITIQSSPTADTRTCDVAKVSKQELLNSSILHIRDVAHALELFSSALVRRAAVHDMDKITDIESFYADFQTGFKQTAWWDRHRAMHRHHLFAADGIPEDVNLIDVIETIADCVMAGMARSGSVYPLQLPEGLLERAFQNTVELLKAHVVVESK